MGVFRNIGVDGCKDGWIVVALSDAGPERPYVVRTFAEVLEREHNATTIAVDIPIGLKRAGWARNCDSQARKMLRHRSCCVFSAPDRDVISSPSYSIAQELSHRHCGKGLSKQAFAIFPKVREVDHLLRQSRPKHVIEVHPELCFFGLAGIPLSESKRQKQGFERRRQILQDYLGIEVLQRAEVQKAVRAKPDDYLDALVAAVAASAYSEGKARHIPEFEEVDECGLAMRMWFPCASE